MNPSNSRAASEFVRYQLDGVTPLSAADEPSHAGQAWLGVVAGGLLAVCTDHVRFHGPVADFREAQIATLQKCLTDDRLAAFLDLNRDGSFFESIHTEAWSASRSSCVLMIDDRSVPAVRSILGGYSATWPLEFDSCPVVVVCAPATLAVTPMLVGL